MVRSIDSPSMTIAVDWDVKQQNKQTDTLKREHMIQHMSFCYLISIPENPPQFENRIMAWVYKRSIMCSTMYQKAPFC